MTYFLPLHALLSKSLLQRGSSIMDGYRSATSSSPQGSISVEYIDQRMALAQLTNLMVMGVTVCTDKLQEKHYKHYTQLDVRNINAQMYLPSYKYYHITANAAQFKSKPLAYYWRY